MEPTTKPEFTIPELIGCVNREANMRRACYPKWDKVDSVENLKPGRKRELAMMVAVGELLTSLPQWVPVSERLPERDNTVLLLTTENGIDLGSLAKVTYSPTANGPALVREEWYTRPSEGYDFEDVTHWMPLPAAPATMEGAQSNG